MPGQEARKFADLKCDPAWKSLTWLGFSSSADAKVVYYLDNLELTNQK